MGETQPGTRRTEYANPFTLILLLLAIAGLGIALVLGVLAQGSYEVEDAASKLLWATMTGAAGFASLLVWLLARALTWKPPAH